MCDAHTVTTGACAASSGPTSPAGLAEICPWQAAESRSIVWLALQTPAVETQKPGFRAGCPSSLGAPTAGSSAQPRSQQIHSGGVRVKTIGLAGTRHRHLCPGSSLQAGTLHAQQPLRTCAVSHGCSGRVMLQSWSDKGEMVMKTELVPSRKEGTLLGSCIVFSGSPLACGAAWHLISVISIGVRQQTSSWEQKCRCN